MKEEKRDNILDNMILISQKVDEGLTKEVQTRGNTIYYHDFEFEGSGLAVENVYIVEILNQKQEETGDNKEEKISTYEIYNNNGELIAKVAAQGKVQFTQEYLEELKNIDKRYFKQLNLSGLTFKLPEELGKEDLVITVEELEEYQNQKLDRNKEGKSQKEEKLGKQGKKEEEKGVEQETEEEKKTKASKALEIDVSEVRAVASINPRQKITDKANFIDLMPEAQKYEEIQIVHTNKGSNSFAILGTTKEGEAEQVSSVEPVEGTTTSKSVISVNEDGSQVEEKQVKGMFRINSRGRNDGIAISTGDYGMMDIDYVSNVMDKEHRRATPIRTKEAENQRVVNSKVRENAGDSIGEMEQEGRIFRQRQEKGINPQTIDGIDIDRADGQSLTLEDLKENIKEAVLEQGDMSKEETQKFIKSEIEKSGLELSNKEIEVTTQEIEQKVLDESRFPNRGNRM